MEAFVEEQDADQSPGTGPFFKLTGSQQMRRIWGSMDRTFRLTVILRNGSEVVGEYCGFLSRLKKLDLWDETGQVFTVSVSDIRDVDLPPDPMFSYI